MPYISPEQDINLTYLYEIADGSDEFIVEFIDLFLQHAPAMLQAIVTAIADKNWDIVAQAAHKLKPNLGSFGMLASQATIQEVELMAKTGSPNADALLAKFNEAYATVSANLITLKQIKIELEKSESR